MLIRTFLIVLLVSVTISGCKPFKVTDPHNPRFDPMQFDFSDYKRDGELAEVLRVMLKPGMQRAEVEKYLVEIGKAQILDQNENDDFGYALDHDADFQKLRRQASQLILYRRSGGGKASGWFVYVFYDQSDHLINVYEWDEKLFDADAMEGKIQ